EPAPSPVASGIVAAPTSPAGPRHAATAGAPRGARVHGAGHPVRRVLRVVARACVAAALAVVATAAPAAADAAGPGNYESEVEALVPDVPGVSAEIRGGDAFLEIDVEPGHEVVVLGYEGEPYLRIDPAGEVFV